MHRGSYPPFDWDVEVRYVAQDEVDELLVSLLADELDEGLGRLLLPDLERGQAIFREHIVKVIHDCKEGSALIAKAISHNYALLEPATVSCSAILMRSDPLTTPMTTFLRRSRRTCINSGEMLCGVRYEDTAGRENADVLDEPG